ncbi:MAG: hypothetical protein U5J96_04070 [Ignavibacteriaceae bacterium]|nr:hypothetical protein [Ignavibacteriaceae bacterium]
MGQILLVCDSLRKEKQEHLFDTYLKDTNTGYKVASEFLNKVTSGITYH